MRIPLIAAGLLAAAALPASAGPQGWQEYGPGTGVVRCESNDGRVRECPTGGGRVVLERQHSRAACIEGRSWGQRRGGVWVANGCRADFRVLGYGYGGPGQAYGRDRVRCESNDGRTRHCALDGRGRPQLVRQLSRAACIEGRTWGADRGGVWVTDGCRGEFAAGRGGGWGGGYGSGDYGYGGRTFRCESNDGRTRECAANVRAGVRLVRQLSRAPCIQGRSWGYGRNGIWVADGCRAEFRTN
ncbi:MAG TPA: DUF3011 domain-containing protein [Thermomonas sp.]|nr:DUF3011 domain-containing protein [Thermomonas sp.]